MNGRYRIPLGTPAIKVPYRIRTATAAAALIQQESERIFRRRWSNFVHTCESLAADGLTYFVSFVLSGDDPHIVTTAAGKVRRKRRQPMGPRIGMVQTVKVVNCATHALEAAWFLPENATKRNANTTHWKRRTERYSELNTMAEEQLRAEVQYWRELELLSGRREHFKPGLRHENRYQDDEVAA